MIKGADAKETVTAKEMGIVKEVGINEDGVRIRKDAEDLLTEHLIKRVRSRIEKEEADRRKQNRKTTVLKLIGWIVSLTGIAMGASQVALA